MASTSPDTTRSPAPAVPLSNRTVETVRGQYHKFMPIPIIEQHTTWFDAGPVSIGVEARALGTSREYMVRGPSIHVCSADHTGEYVRFDVFGSVLHYHYILPHRGHNILWGYDPDLNGPMVPWAVAALRERLPVMLRRADAAELATQVEEQGWDTSVLDAVERTALAALAPRDDDLERAREGMAWMERWKEIHPQFNTVDD